MERNTVKTAIEHEIQVSDTGERVWVHTNDGSTVGRFDKRFGIDVHTTVAAQLEGASQCLMCSHEPAGPEQWAQFCQAMLDHYDILIPADLISFSDEPTQQRRFT